MWPFLQTPNTSCGCEQSGTNQCGCDKISSLDVSYNGPALVCSGIELCDSLTVALQKIEEKICTTGNISGSGTNNYIPKWTPNGTTLGNSQMRDDGVTIGIGTFYGSPIHKFSIESNLPNTFINNTINTTTAYFALSVGASDNTNVPKNNYTGTGIFGYADSSTTQNIGVRGRAQGINAILNIGVNGSGIATLNNPCVTSLGGKFEAGFGTNNYSVQLIDGTQQTGRFLKSVTNDGHANWANITAADVSGVVGGSGTTNYISKWTPDGSTLGDSIIQNIGDQLSIGAAPDPISKFYIVDNIYSITQKILQTKPTGLNNVFVVESSGIGASANTAITGSAAGATINIGVAGTVSGGSLNYAGFFQSSNATTNVGIYAQAGGTGLKYAARLKDGTEGIGKVLTCVTADGDTNWATPISGSGTNNYVARWTPSGTQLGIGLIQDDNISIGIKTFTDSERLINAASSTHRFGNFVEVSPTVTTPGQNTIAISGIAQGTNSGADTFGVTGYASGSTSQNSGILGAAIGITTADNIGGSFIATNSSVLNTAIIGSAKSNVTGINIGGAFEATSSTTANYSVQLKDGTEGVNKALTSVTSDGKANWNKISSSYTTGATGSFTSQDGKTITVTNGLITSII